MDESFTLNTTTTSSSTAIYNNNSNSGNMNIATTIPTTNTNTINVNNKRPRSTTPLQQHQSSSLLMNNDNKNDNEKSNPTTTQPKVTSILDEEKNRAQRLLQGLMNTNDPNDSSNSNTKNHNNRNIMYTELNELLSLSYNHDMNYHMKSDVILHALCTIVYHYIIVIKCNKYNTNQQHHINEFPIVIKDTNLIMLRANTTWIEPPTNEMKQFLQLIRHCITSTESDNDNDVYKICCIISMIFRNLSYTNANLRLFAYSPMVLQTLILLLLYYSGTTTTNSNNTTTNNNESNTIVLSILQTLRHIVPYMDVTGQQLLIDKLFYDGRTLGSNTILTNTNTTNTNTNNSTTILGDGPAVPYSNEYGQCIYNDIGFGTGGFGIYYYTKQYDSKEDIIQNMKYISNNILFHCTGQYLISIYSIFPVLYDILLNVHTSRNVLISIFDLLIDLMNIARIGIVGNVYVDDMSIQPGQEYTIPNLRSILVNIPNTIIDRLIHLLYIPKHGPNSIDYIDPIEQPVSVGTTTGGNVKQQPNIFPNKLLLLGGYNTMIDYECRDRILDILVPLLELDSPNMAIRFGRKEIKENIPIRSSTNSRNEHNNTNQTITKSVVRVELYDAILPILTTTVGRNDASILAGQLLRELIKAKDENQNGFIYVKSRLMEIASRDVRVSQLVWNDLYPIQFEEDDDEEEEDEDDDEDINNNDDTIGTSEHHGNGRNVLVG